MDALADRIFKVRKFLKLSQADFGEKIKLSPNFIWLMEKGQREPSDRTISDICRVFGINEVWLRSGNGEMMRPKGREEEIANIARAANNANPDEATAYFHNLLENMSDGEILLLYRIFKKHFSSQK